MTIGILLVFVSCLLATHWKIAIASAVDMIIPENVEELKLPNIVSDSFQKDNEAIDDTVPDISTQHLSCRVYIAPSTIPGAGMGVFAGQAFGKGDEVTTADAVVPLYDIAWHNNATSMKNNFLWDEYAWEGDSFSGMEEPGHNIEGASFGIGALPNCFFPLLNVEDSHTIRDNAAIEPGIDPGSGAFTVFHDRRGTAMRDIRAGEEIFVDYGYSYFSGDREDIYGLMPFLPDYKVADRLLHRFRKVSQQLDWMISSAKGNKRTKHHHSEKSERDSPMKELLEKILQTWPNEKHDELSPSDLLTLAQRYREINNQFREDTTTNQRRQPQKSDSKGSENETFANELYELLKTVIQTWPSRTQGALPASVSGVNNVLDELRSTKYIYAERSIRDVNWLHEHGSCLDHLVVRNSTIPHAGRGAFANKFLTKGTVVAPVPLIHLPQREVLNMYRGLIQSNAEYNRNADDLIHYQLLLNYCFGHPESSLLLCPYGIASSLVNHGSLKKSQANVKIVWSNKTSSKPEWLDLPLDEWAFKYQAGLAFDYVAIRDIHEGEEVLVDYGEEWEAAWDQHVNTWKPKPFMSQILNGKEPPVDIPQSDEWPWPATHLWCRNIYRHFQGLPLENDYAYPCRVISKAVDKETGEILYTAEVIERFHGVSGEEGAKAPETICGETSEEILFSLPRDAFLFGGSFDWDEGNRYYAETWSFRHDLRIPEHLMPEKWKNLS